MAAFLDNCKFTPTAGGTTDWTYSLAVGGYQSPAAAGAVNGEKYKYFAISADLSQWEIGEGAYNTSTGVLARTTVLYNSSGTGTAAGQSGAGTKISFSAAPSVAVVALKEDLLALDEANSFTATQQNQAQKNLGIPGVLAGYISGLTLSTAGSSATFSVATGVAADSTAADMMALSSSISKTTSAWAVGTGSGALDTGTIAASTWYHAYLIKNISTQTVDVLVSLSATTPTLPSGYTLARRIGSMKTDGSSHWTAFSQFGNYFRWATPVLDVSNVSFPNTYTTQTISVPPGVQVLAHGNLAPGTGGSIIQIRPVGASDTMSNGITTFTANPLGKAGGSISGTSPQVVGSWREVTNTSSQISVGGNGTVASYLTTEGWEDNRGAGVIAGSSVVDSRTIAKAWGKFAGGTTPSLTEGLNVASVSHSATGVYVVTFTAPFADANFTAIPSSSGGGFIAIITAQTTSTVTISTVGSTGSATDATTFYFIAFGT